MSKWQQADFRGGKEDILGKEGAICQRTQVSQFIELCVQVIIEYKNVAKKYALILFLKVERERETK